MPKEDRSDWVAVGPEHTHGGASAGETATSIRKVTTAYQFFQKDAAEQIRREYGKVSDIAQHGRLVKEKWNALTPPQREHYENLHRLDLSRFAQESHQADIAALERKQKLQQERETVLLDTEGGPKRMTRGGWDKKQRKQARREKQKGRQRKDGNDDNNDEEEWREEEVDDEDSSHVSWDSNASSNDDSDSDHQKKKAKRKAPAVSQKQLDYRAKQRQEKQEKEEYIASRQEDLRRERSTQAKRRLEYLLKQGGNIFSHFGRVKEDTAKYGIRAADRQRKEATGVARRGSGAEPASSADGLQPDDDENQEEALEEADEHEATFLTAQPKTLGFGKMRPYQLEGLNWMIRLQENGVNGILADEMGLGKTLQSISILVYMLEYLGVSGPHLIVVPKSTLSNWMNEIKRWSPTLTAIRFHGDKPTREEIAKTQLEPAQRDENREWNIVVTTYEVCSIEKNVLSRFAWTYLIIDEAHRLKNEASAFSKTVRLFETKHRILLTGTPLQNSLHELWALLNFLVPDVFESADQFDDWFNLDIDDNDEKNKLISQLHKILRPFMLRRLKVDVEKSLPPKHETILFTGMSAMQKKLYRDILIRDIDAIRGNAGNRTAILNIVMQLRKCAGHPYLFPGVEDRTLPPLGEHLVENCGKMVLLDKLLKRMRQLGHRVLLFTQMTRLLDIMEDYLVMRKYPYCRIDGNTTHEDREEYIDRFNAPDSDKFIFLLSTRAGGLGINLQTANIVILFDSDWNPQADLQAQDRAHRIGQKKPVQVFRLVTEHTIEEKIVERAQQKLKLDAMVVQQGRLKEKDKLSREELLAAVRFGADKIFKSKDSSITDDDIDMILDLGKRKTEELNEKLKAADKGDLLDFRLDGSSVQTFEGVDYSNALAQAKAESDMFGIFDIGKRERKEANYNENSLYQQQIAALQGSVTKKPKKKKDVRLPKHLRLPRMEEWQMYDRPSLLRIQEEEEMAFKALPEEQQKLALRPPEELADNPEEQQKFAELPPLISEERQAEKSRLLAEGFRDWKRFDYNTFVKLSGELGRKNAPSKIALQLGKTEEQVRDFMNAFWGNRGKTRIVEHEYDRVVKFVERGEKKIEEVKSLERATRVLVSHFDNPWKELEFTHVNCKDKMFTMEEDRHLLCWAFKYGYGQWQAVKLAVRKCPQFRFDYFLRSLPVDQIGRRSEQLMKAAEKEVEQLERTFREDNGLRVEPEVEGGELPPVELPRFGVLQRERRKKKTIEAEKEKRQLEEKVNEIEAQIKAAQTRLKELTEGTLELPRVSPDVRDEVSDVTSNRDEKQQAKDISVKEKREVEDDHEDGAAGPDGAFVPFPAYDASEPPVEWKKPFTQFCIRTRKEVKRSLDPSDRKNKEKVHSMLKERWARLNDDDKAVWRDWTEWDRKRYARDRDLFENRRSISARPSDDGKIPKKRKAEDLAVPKKKKNRS